MATRDAAPAPHVDPTWREYRLLPAGFGVQPVEDRVIVAPAPPSANAFQIADGTPEYDWAISRQWLPDSGPDGVTPAAMAGARDAPPAPSRAIGG